MASLPPWRWLGLADARERSGDGAEPANHCTPAALRSAPGRTRSLPRVCTVCIGLAEPVSPRRRPIAAQCWPVRIGRYRPPANWVAVAMPQRPVSEPRAHGGAGRRVSRHERCRVPAPSLRIATDAIPAAASLGTPVSIPRDASATFPRSARRTSPLSTCRALAPHTAVRDAIGQL